MYIECFKAMWKPRVLKKVTLGIRTRVKWWCNHVGWQVEIRIRMMKILLQTVQQSSATLRVGVFTYSGSVLIHTHQLFFTWLKMDKLIVIVILQLTEPPTAQEWSIVNPVSLEPYSCFEAGRDRWGMVLIWSLIIIQIAFPWSHSELFRFWIRHGN